MAKQKNPFKSFVAYEASKPMLEAIIARSGYDASIDFTDDVLDKFKAIDPSSTAWRSQGLAHAHGEQYVATIEQNKTYLMMVQFNERILPSKVRDEYLAKLIADFKERSDRNMSKKDYAMLKEQAEFDLLPKAFIKRTLVPVLIVKRHRFHGVEARNYVFICTTSPKRADDTLAVLTGVFSNFVDTDFGLRQIRPVKGIVEVLTSVAHNSSTEHETLWAGSSATLKGAGRQTIRVKDRDIGGHEVQEILKQGYDVHELGLSYFPNGQGEEIDPAATFSVNDKFIFKGIKFGDVEMARESSKAEDAEALFLSVAFIAATLMRDFFTDLMIEMGGVAEHVVDAEPADPLNADDSDDEEL